MKPYYKDTLPTIYCADCLEGMRELPDVSIDLLCTDPPYGLSFMGKDWDKAVPKVEVWKECLRVLKPGAFVFVMCIPRQDCLGRMIANLQDAGFDTGFTSIYWAYASGFPKAQNIGKAVDKRLGVKREVVGENPWNIVRHHHKETWSGATRQTGYADGMDGQSDITKPATPQAKALDGSYGGFQPKPAVEVILVCMKPLSEKTYVDQALKNQKGITWLDDGRIPFEDKDLQERKQRDGIEAVNKEYEGRLFARDKAIIATNYSGRFPANLLVSEDVLDDGRERTSGKMAAGITRQNRNGYSAPMPEVTNVETIGDSGTFSRYFSLDQWAQRTFPFLIVPKASRQEKEKGLEDMPEKPCRGNYQDASQFGLLEKIQNSPRPTAKNYHPTCKPLKLMSYLITLGTREGDTVLDPFVGSGTTCLAAKMLKRKSIGFEIHEPYCQIAAKRCQQNIQTTMIMEM